MFPPQCSCCSASSVFCSIALRLLFCSPLSAGCSASPLCFLLFPPQVLDLVSRSSRKDSAETLLCLAERASLLRVCTVLMLCETTGRGLEICVTVSDLVLPHLCVCVCMSCLWNLSVFAVILRTCPRVSVLFCLFVSFVGLYAIVSRPDSAEGFSSCPSTGSRNGEKDWENESTTSSTPSNAEYTGTICACDVYTPPRPLYVTWYPFFFCDLTLSFFPTGPKLYKEPSAKSNKHIIQNALAHCCLAGKVNEGQKNKILDVCFDLIILDKLSWVLIKESPLSDFSLEH